MTTKSRKWVRPVSRKFYGSITESVRNAAAISKDVNADNVMQGVDVYIEQGILPMGFTETELVVFTLLQPLIDKAVKRSRLARENAIRRKQLKAGTASATAVTTEASEAVVSTSDDESAVSCAPPPDALSREDKRALRREESRQKRHQKHLKRLSRRHKPIPSP